MTKNPDPLSIPASLAMGAGALSPVIGAAFSLVQRSWVPLGLGATCAAGLFIAYAVGSALAEGRKARKIDLRADPADFLEAAYEENDRQAEEIGELLAQIEQLRRCWSCGMEQGDLDGPGASRPDSESGKRGRDDYPKQPLRPIPPTDRRGA